MGFDFTLPLVVVRDEVVGVGFGVGLGLGGKPGKTKSATWKSPSLVSDPKTATTIPVSILEKEFICEKRKEM